MRKPYKKVKNDAKRKELRRKLTIRKRLEGTTERPRICVSKSNKNLFVQVIDDTLGKTLFSVQTFGKAAVGSCNKEGAKKLGLEVANKLKEHNQEKVVFDRNGKKYTGVIQTVADSIREGGIQI